MSPAFPWRSNAMLLGATVVWGSGFVAQRYGLQHLGPLSFNAFRFLLAAVFLVPVAALSRGSSLSVPGRREWIAAFWAGVALFAGAAFQQAGLAGTTAGQAGFITGLYIVFVPLIGRFLGYPLTATIWTGAVMSVAGLYLMSVEDGFRLSRGDTLVLCGAVCWAWHVLVIARFATDMDPLRLAIGQNLVCALLSLAIALPLERPGLEDLWAGRLPVLYSAFVAIGLGFTLQIFGQRGTHPAHAAILLSLEAVFAAAFGCWILRECLSPRASLGAALMLVGAIATQMPRLLENRFPRLFRRGPR